MILSKDEIKVFKENKDLITMDLLTELRSQGNDGKDVQLEILDMPKNEEGYYVDQYGNRISFNGNRGLKKTNTQHNLSEIHYQEIERCQTDIHYFKDNYLKIVTPKGVTFPTIRKYQNDFLTQVSGEAQDIVALMPRQSGKSISTGMYLAHSYTFMKNINMGIVQNRGSTAREFLDKTKQMIINLPIWLQPQTEIWNKTSIQSDNGVKLMTDVPSADSFRGSSMHLLVVDETQFIRTTVFQEFSDSIFPSQSGLAWKKNILLSTQNGQNHFYDIVEGARAKRNGFELVEVSWEDTPRFKKDGTQYTNQEFKKAIIDKHGEVHFAQNYACSFLGSSHTILSQEVMESLHPSEPLYKRDNMLNVYEDPQPNQKYILTVDAQKDGGDYFTVNIFSISNFPFEQVQAQKLHVNYLKMPAFILEWAESYNYAYVIVENNEGAGQSVQDVLHTEYEYENLHFDKKINTKIRKNKEYPGFRTTRGNRSVLLNTLQTFIEEEKLIVHDKELIEEFKHFILINGKYQADDGYHDDMVMGTQLLFAPFIDLKNFDGFSEIIGALFGKDQDQEFDFMDSIVFGSFDQEYDEEFQGLGDREYDEDLDF